MRVITLSKTIMTLILPLGLLVGAFILQLRLGFDVAMFPLYMFSIAIISWTLGRVGGVVSVFVASLLWYFGATSTNYQFSHSWTLPYNLAVRVLLFMVTAYSIITFRRMVEQHRQRMEALRSILNVYMAADLCKGETVNDILSRISQIYKSAGSGNIPPVKIEYLQKGKSDSSIRILHVISSMNPADGGPIEGVKQLSLINASYGHVVHVVCLDEPNSPWLDKYQMPIHAIGPALTAYGYSSNLVPWLREHRQDYDVVIVNGIWGYNLHACWRALRKTATPYYVYTHGMLDPWFKYRYPLKHAKKWLFWPWSVFPALRDARGVFFTCEEERRLAKKSFWLYDCNEIVVSYGTPGPPDPEKNYAKPFLDQRPDLVPFRRFIFLGRVHPKKGPDIIIKVLARLHASGHWDPKTMKLLMAGPADGEYASKLKALASNLGVTESITWTGMLLGDEKWGALQSSEAFLLPSHQENFGIAVAEALSVNVPVLISKSVNIWREIVEDGGGTADEDTVAGFERQFINWLALSPESVADTQYAAKACFERRFTSKRAAVSMLSNIYQGLVADRMNTSSDKALDGH